MLRMVPVVFGLVLLVTGCDRLLGLSHRDPPEPDAQRPTTALVQQTTASNPSATSLAATLLAPPTSGNVLVVIGATDVSDLLPPSGGGVSTWARAASSFMYSGIEIWYGITDGSSSTISVTCSPPTLGTIRVSVTEWSGLATSNLFETGSDAAGPASSAAATASLTTLASPDLLVFGVSSYDTIATAAMGTGTWTALDSIGVGPVTQSQWYQLVSEPGSYAGSVTVNGNWDAALAAFRAR